MNRNMYPPEPDCGLCGACEIHWAPEPDPANPLAGWSRKFIVCAVCGNKRCPHATDHRLACTGSNLPNQPGSSYQYRYFDDEKEALP